MLKFTVSPLLANVIKLHKIAQLLTYMLYYLVTNFSHFRIESTIEFVE